MTGLAASIETGSYFAATVDECRKRTTSSGTS
jgi:hypothetical protein